MIEPLSIEEDECVVFAEDRGTYAWVYVAEDVRHEPILLDADEAQELRDWLTKWLDTRNG